MQLRRTAIPNLHDPQKIAVPRRREFQVSEPPVVNRHIVQVPQADVRKIGGEDALNCGVFLPPYLQIRRGSSFREQPTTYGFV